MATQELEFTTRLTREDVAGIIEALIEGLKDGHLKVQKSGEALELDVPRVVDLEVEAKLDEERASFEIEVSWRTNRAENPDNAPEDTSSCLGKAATPDSATVKAKIKRVPLLGKKRAVKETT